MHGQRLGGRAVLFNQSNGTIKNEVGGVITGFFIGIEVQGGGTTVTNRGSIKASDIAVYLGASSVDAQLDNHGSIYGQGLGVRQSSFGNGVINNTGSIVGDVAGIQVILAGNFLKTAITNSASGLIKGEVLSITIAVGAVELTNRGVIDGGIGSFAPGADDVVVNRGKMKGGTFLGDGNDSFKSAGKGKAGLIDMGPGNDRVAFGKKADKLLFDSALNAATNVDRVKKFESGKDKFFLDDDIFTTIAPGTLSSSAFRKGAAAADANDRIIYDKKTGALYFDPDGAGGAPQTQFAKLDPGTKLKARDFTIGEYSIML
jgi:hypothetical protein